MALSYPNFRNVTPTTRLPGGYQTGNPADIARRYSPNRVTLQSNLNNVAWSGANPPSTIPPRLPSAMPTGGAAGPVGEAGVDAMPWRAVSGGSPETSDGVAPPPGNATQRWTSKEDWTAAGGSSRTFNRANVARGVRSAIDARATPAPQNARTDFNSTFGPGRAHMGNTGTTWEQRQANNQAGVQSASEQRGLPY